MASKRFLELVDKIKDLHERKNAGYAGKDAVDPWANFRMSEMMDISAFKGCLVRMSDKFIRIANLSKDEQNDKVGESITDTLLDLAVYSLIAICLYEEQLAEVEFNQSLMYGTFHEEEEWPPKLENYDYPPVIRGRIHQQDPEFLRRLDNALKRALSNFEQMNEPVERTMPVLDEEESCQSDD